MDSEAGVFAMAFDNSGTRLITAEADKTIKLYREDDTAVSILIGVSRINDKLLVLLYFQYHYYLCFHMCICLTILKHLKIITINFNNIF